MKKPPLTDRDGEVREITKEDMKKFRPAAKADPGMVSAVKAARGRPPVESPKQTITLRMNPALIDAIRATGKGYNTRVEKVLKDALNKGKL